MGIILQEILDNVISQTVKLALELSGNRRNQAAEALGISYKQLMRYILKFDIKQSKTFSLDDILEHIEKHAIEVALVVSNGNVALAGRMIGMKRTTLLMKTERFGINVDEFRDLVGEQQEVKVVKQGNYRVNTGNILRHEVMAKILEVYKENNQNKTQTAKQLGIGVKTVLKYIRIAEVEASEWGWGRKPGPYDTCIEKDEVDPVLEEEQMNRDANKALGSLLTINVGKKVTL